MHNQILFFAALLTLLSACHSRQRAEAIRRLAEPQTLNAVKEYMNGKWESIAVELRPGEDRTGSGQVQSTYLRRRFEYHANDMFTGVITLYADNYGKLPLMEFEFRGHLNWGEPHSVAKGAWNLDYVLDEGFGVTPLHEQAADMLNTALPPGMPSFKSGVKQDILRKAFPLFNISEGQIVTDYDLIYFSHGMLFMGAKHVNGMPFDKPENRPHQLQIPLRKTS
ncbi:MAG: hypothetical protein ACK4NS_12000 [Saprospiraceae bacterium]